MNQVKDFFEYIFNAVKIFVILQPWQTGIRVRNGKKIKKLEGGIYFKLPYFDSVFIQEKRLRIVTLPIQTITTNDGVCFTISGAFGYLVSDVEKLFNTLFHPETTLVNMVMSEIADYVYSNKGSEIKPKSIEETVMKNLIELDYGLKFEYFKLANFASVKTLRLIQDTSWFYEGNSMEKHK